VPGDVGDRALLPADGRVSVLLAAWHRSVDVRVSVLLAAWHRSVDVRVSVPLPP
jgi:hypothetical protein